MATTTSAIFNGNSRYSSDFQAVIDRATAIASLPITQLNRNKTALGDQTTALTGLDSKFTALQTAVTAIGQALGGGSFQAAVSDSLKLSATLGDGAIEGNYSVQVVDPGAYATSMTTASWNDAPGPVHTYKLVLGGVQYGVSAADNSAASVASAINSRYGDKVRAIVVNVGSSGTPDYRISLQATQLGNLSPDLLDGSTSLQTQQTPGAEAQYIVNGSGTTVHSSSRTITIATGVTVNLLAASNSAVNITVTRSSSALSSALNGFATAYNAAVDQLDKQHGTTSGALAGQSIVSDLSSVLSRIATYTASGSQVGGLSGLGFDLDKTGHLTFNSLSLMATDLTNSSGVTSFLGSATGGGLLKLATDALNGVEQTGTGLLPSAEASVKAQSSSIDSEIANQQAVVDRMKERLQAQMAAMDALVASMEQQYNYFSSLFAAELNLNKQYA